MADVGIRLSMTENVSAMSPKVSSALRDISSAGEEMKSALQLGDLEEKYRQFAERVDKLYDTQQTNKQKQQDDSRQQREEERQSQQNLQRLSALPTQVVGGVGTAATRAGGGDVAGAAGGLFGMLQGLLKTIGPLGAAVGLVGAGAMAGMAVEQQYEKQLPGVMSLSAVLGRLSKEVGSAGDVFVRTMNEAAEVGADFVYSLEESVAIFQQFARAGGRREEYVGRAMEYGRGYGADPTALAGFLGTFQRFGGTGNILGTVAGGLEQSGMGAGRYQEFLESTLSIFEEGLSRGVSKGFEDIVTTQSWLAQMGEVFTGQTGLNTYRKLEAATAGATALSREQDIILFRAAREAIGKDASYVEVMKRLETGIDATIFGNVRRQVFEMSTSDADRVEMMRSIFGVEYGVAEKLLTLPSSAAAAMVAKAPTIESDETRVMKAQLGISQQIRNFGAEIVRTKAWAVEGAEKIINGLAWIMGVGPPTEDQMRNEAVKDFLQAEEEKAITGQLRTDTMEGVSPLRTQFENTIANVLAEGIGARAEDTRAAKSLKNVFANMTTEQRSKISEYVGTTEGGMHGSIFDYLEYTGWMHTAPGEKGMGLVGGDLPKILEDLIAVMKSLDIHVAEDKTTNITVEEAPAAKTEHYGGSGFTE